MKIFLRLFVVVLAFLCSCSGSDYSQSYQIRNESWSADDILQFNIDIEDIYQNYNLYINIRNTDEYSYSNIFLFVNVMYPDNTLYIDTVEGVLADAGGRWLGSGSSRYKNNKFLYKSNIVFPQKGVYVFTIEQAMRVRSLDGIAVVGLELENLNTD